MQYLQDIYKNCGLIVQSFGQVHGGDINDAYCLHTSTGKHFLKVNDKNAYPAMFEKEASGLDLLRKNSSLIIPAVICSGTAGNKQYLLLEWMEKGSPQKDMWEKFGEGLALMHKQPQQYFGLHEDNYIGSLKQVNTQHSEWPSFYTECRILPLIKILFDNGAASSKDANTAEKFCKGLENIFPKEPPSLLHGDLWAGNYLVHLSGHAAIYDPAIYYGHREMDIGMTTLFGGFDQRFYNSYNATNPLAKGWEKRLPVGQLYPILVHAVLFGGHYLSQAIETLKQFT